jgi:hypothetical protein
LSGFGVEGGKVDFRESWRRKSRLFPNKNYSGCHLLLGPQVKPMDDTTRHGKVIVTIGPVRKRVVLKWAHTMPCHPFDAHLYTTIRRVHVVCKSSAVRS